MSETTGRFDWLKIVNTVLLIMLLVAAAAVMVYFIADLIVLLTSGTTYDREEVVARIGVILGAMIGAAVAVLVFGLVRMAISCHNNLANVAGQTGRLETLLEDQGSSARKLVELATLTDEAKSLLYREREVEAVRETMHTLLVRGDYKLAEELLNGIEKKPSLAQDAAMMRQELEATRQATIEGKIELALGRVEDIILKCDWPRAVREAARMRVAFPTNSRIAALPQRIDKARMKHKRDLLQSYGEAVRKNDVDASIELLKELDPYLSPQEAAALQDSARGVFKAKLHNLGVQFAIRVAENQWAEAIAVGEDIIRDYPNSRMAHEVRSKMDQLHQRAGAGNPDPGDAAKK